MAFATRISRARFAVTGYTPQQMVGMAEFLRGVIFKRLDQGVTIYDTPAPPLSDKAARKARNMAEWVGTGETGRGYRSWKRRKTGRDKRDLNLTGETRRGIRVLRASVNHAVLGPIPASKRNFGQGYRQKWRLLAGKQTLTYAGILAVNNWRSPQWGVSPNDRRALAAYIDTLPSPVQAKAA